MKTLSVSAIGAVLLAGVVATGLTASTMTTAHSAPPPPNIEQFALPQSVHHLEATVTHSQANMSILRKIGPGFADGYRVSSATYVFTAPDRVEVHGKAGIFSGTVTYTNSLMKVDLGIVHTSKDISKDVTKRQTVFSLGLLPQNYLDTVRADYVGPDTADGAPCQVFMLRYITDAPTSDRRFEIWVSTDKHYVIKKTVWDGGNHQHETIMYKDPIQAMPGVWVPQRAEAYDVQGELGGVALQNSISAN